MVRGYESFPNEVSIDFADDKIESKTYEALGYCFCLLGLFHFAFDFTNCLFHNCHPVLSSPVVGEDRANVSNIL